MCATHSLTHPHTLNVLLLFIKIVIIRLSTTKGKEEWGTLTQRKSRTKERKNTFDIIVIYYTLASLLYLLPVSRARARGKKYVSICLIQVFFCSVWRLLWSLSLSAKSHLRRVFHISVSIRLIGRGENNISVVLCTIEQ